MLIVMSHACSANKPLSGQPAIFYSKHCKVIQPNSFILAMYIGATPLTFTIFIPVSMTLTLVGIPRSAENKSVVFIFVQSFQ